MKGPAARIFNYSVYSKLSFTSTRMAFKLMAHTIKKLKSILDG